MEGGWREETLVRLGWREPSQMPLPPCAPLAAAYLGPKLDTAFAVVHPLSVRARRRGKVLGRREAGGEGVC